jgi:uncharacterized membrane protein YtjA (UPF0391 family)
VPPIRPDSLLSAAYGSGGRLARALRYQWQMWGDGGGNARPPQHRHPIRLAKGAIMLHYAVVFFVIALIAALFGFGGIAAGAAEIAKVLFFIFLVLFIVSLVVGLFRRGT